MAAPVANQPNLPPNPPGADGTQIMVPIKTISGTVDAISQDIAKIDKIRSDVSTQYTNALTSVGKLLADTEGFINNVNLTSAKNTEAHNTQHTQLLEEKKKFEDANALVNEKMRQLEAELQEMKIKAQNTDAQMAYLKKEHNDLVAQKAQLDEEKKTLDAQVINLKQQHEQLNQAKTQLDAEHQKLQNTHQTLQSVHVTLQSDIVNANTSLTSLVQKILDLQKSINTLHLTDVKLTKYIDMYAQAPYLIRIRSKFFSDIHNVNSITDGYVTQISTNMFDIIHGMFKEIISIIRKTNEIVPIIRKTNDYESKINTAWKVWKTEVNGVSGAYFLCARWLSEQNPSATVSDTVTQKVNAYLGNQ